MQIHEASLSALVSELTTLDVVKDLQNTVDHMSDDIKGRIHPFLLPTRRPLESNPPEIAKIIHRHTPRHGLLRIIPKSTSDGYDASEAATNLAIGRYEFCTLELPYTRLNQQSSNTNVFLRIDYDPPSSQSNGTTLPLLVHPIGHLVCCANSRGGDNDYWRYTPS